MGGEEQGRGGREGGRKRGTEHEESERTHSSLVFVNHACESGFVGSGVLGIWVPWA